MSWFIVLTHILCFAAGGFVFTHPETVKASLAKLLDKIKPEAKS